MDNHTPISIYAYIVHVSLHTYSSYTYRTCTITLQLHLAVTLSFVSATYLTIFSISASFVTFSQYQYELGFSFKKFNRFSNHKLDIFFKFLHYSVNLVQYCFFSISNDDILVKKNTENIYLKTILIQQNYNDDIRKMKLVNHFLSWELGKMREKTQIKNQFFFN